MDRVAALADILPPLPPDATAAASPWAQPWAIPGLVLLLGAALWAALWWRRARPWRAVAAAAHAAVSDAPSPAMQAAAIAAALRPALPDGDWPATLRERLDALRYRDLPAERAAEELQALGRATAHATRAAWRAAALSPRRARTAFIRAWEREAQP